MTGGVYSVYRGLLGLWFLLFFAAHLPAGADPLTPHGPLAALLSLLPDWLAGPLHVYLGCFLSVFFALGRRDWICAWALLLVFPWLTTDGLNPVTTPGFLLCLHLFAPKAPFGSMDALGRLDPGGGVRFSPYFAKVAWLYPAAGWTASWVALVAGPKPDGWAQAAAAAFGFPSGLPDAVTGLLVGLVSAALIMLLTGRMRLPVWSLLFGAYLLLTLFALEQAPTLLLLLLVLERQWLPPVREPDLLFYDGNCGMCHRATRFVLAEDTDGTCFEMAPLEGETFATLVPKDTAAKLPDSLIVRRRNGELLDRSRAVLLILDHLGGFWRLLARLGKLIPRLLLDKMYEGVARVRHRFFDKPKDACPILPPHLRSRFRW